MANSTTGKQAASNVPATQKNGQVAQSFIEYKNKITSSVLNKISDLRKGGITVPAGYSADNQIYLAFLKLTGMTGKSGQPLLSEVKPQSVANALLTMCIKGLSLEKGQCVFIQYGNELQFQEEYHGRVALAKRYGAGDPQAQVIYEGDEFEYEIDVTTGKKVVKKHVQKLQNIDNSKIIGAWALVPYADHTDWQPKIEVMTIAEIRQSWAQGATKGNSPAHRNFTQEMAKKTVISRACKLFITTSDDAGIYDDQETAEYQEQPRQEAGIANSKDAVFTELPSEPAPEEEVKEAADAVVDTQTGEVTEAPAPEEVQAAADAEGEDIPDGFFNM